MFVLKCPNGALTSDVLEQIRLFKSHPTTCLIPPFSAVFVYLLTAKKQQPH